MERSLGRLLAFVFAICVFTCLLCLIFTQHRCYSDTQNNSNQTNIGSAIPEGVDVAVYTFSYGPDDGVKVETRLLRNNQFLPCQISMGIGYSSTVDLGSLEPLYDYFSLTNYKSLQEKLGQYFTYRNYDGVKVFVFYNWQISPRVLNIVIYDEGEIIHISEEYHSDNTLPIAISCEGSDVFILLRDRMQFSVKKINLTSHAENTYAFSLDEFSTNYYYYVDTFVESNMLYLFVNEYVKPVDAMENTPSGYVGGYLYTFDFDTEILNEQSLSTSKVEFVGHDSDTILWGEYGEDLLTISKMFMLNHSCETYSVLLDTDDFVITPNSALYEKGTLLLNLSGMGEKSQEGLFCVIDTDVLSVKGTWMYEFDGGVCVKYYLDNYDHPHSSSN